MKTSMKTLLVALPIATSLIGSLRAQTNQFYITDERKTSYEDTAFSPEQIERAKHAKESRPAEQDLEGHWGPVTEGFQISIRLEKESFTNGGPVVACLILRNVSDRQLRYSESYYGPERDWGLVLMRDQERVYGKDEPKPGASFAEKLKGMRQGSSGSWPIEAGTQRKFSLDLSKIFGLATNGEYVVQAMRTIPSLDRTSEKEVASGKVAFRITDPPKPPAARQ
jgi:hypothetical protein